MKRDFYSDSFFFYPHELIKILPKSSTKHYCIKLHYLGWRTEPKGFFLFFRVAYHTGRDQRVPPFISFLALRDFFFEKFFPHMVFPSIFICCFASEWMLENANESPLTVFFGTVRFFPENNNCPLIFLMFCD